MSTSAGKPPVMRNATQATCASRKRAIRWPTITGVLQTRRDPGRIVMADTPENLRFGEDHLWADPAGDPLVRVGITDYAQQSLGDVIAVTPPEVGAAITAGEACGEIESTKSLSDLISPITGTVELRNDELVESPDLVNSDPYGKGWIFEARVEPATLAEQLALLMDAAAYRDSTGA